MNPTQNKELLNKNLDAIKAGATSFDASGNWQAPTPAPVVPSSTSTLVDRYAKQKEEINTNPVYNQTAPDENVIRESYRQRNMQYVDAIKSQFDKYINEDTQAKQDLTSRAYLGSLASGLSGTISGASKEYKASETGQNKIRATIADREAAIAKVLQDGDLRASEEFNKRRTEYLGSAKDKIMAEQNLSEKIKAQAESDIGTLAQNRSYADLQKTSPKIIDQYKKELNLDDTQLQALFISKTPKAQEVKLADGSIAYYQPITDDNGNVTMKEVGRIKGANGKEISSSKITDNGVQILYKDGTYEFKGNNGKTTPGDDIKPPTGTPKNFTMDDIPKGKEMLSRSGTGGYADPGTYYAVYKMWIEDGGSENKFMELYPPEQFANPERADQYPTFLQPPASITKETRSA